MDITITTNNGDGRVLIKRARKGKKARSGSQILYWLKQILNENGYDLIKKLMWKDGHLYGDDKLHYLRSRNPKEDPWVMIYDGDYAVRSMKADYNWGKLVTLLVTTQFAKEGK